MKDIQVLAYLKEADVLLQAQTTEGDEGEALVDYYLYDTENIGYVEPGDGGQLEIEGVNPNNVTVNDLIQTVIDYENYDDCEVVILKKEEY